MEASLAGKQIIHPAFSDNICFTREFATEGVDAAFAKAASEGIVAEETYDFVRHTELGALPEPKFTHRFC